MLQLLAVLASVAERWITQPMPRYSKSGQSVASQLLRHSETIIVHKTKGSFHWCLLRVPCSNLEIPFGCGNYRAKHFQRDWNYAWTQRRFIIVIGYQQIEYSLVLQFATWDRMARKSGNGQPSWCNHTKPSYNQKSHAVDTIHIINAPATLAIKFNYIFSLHVIKDPVFILWELVPRPRIWCWSGGCKNAPVTVH